MQKEESKAQLYQNQSLKPLTYSGTDSMQWDLKGLERTQKDSVSARFQYTNILDKKVPPKRSLSISLIKNSLVIAILMSESPR